MIEEMEENGREGNWRIEELYEGIQDYPVSKADLGEIREEIAERQNGIIGGQRIRKRKDVIEREYQFDFLHGKNKM